MTFKTNVRAPAYALALLPAPVSTENTEADWRL